MFRSFFWTYLTSIGDPGHYHNVVYTQRLRSALWYYAQLIVIAAFLIALGTAFIIPSTITDGAARIATYIEANVPTPYTISFAPETGAASTTLAEPFVLPTTSILPASNERYTHLIVIDTSTSTASTSAAAPQKTLTQMSTMMLLTRDALYAFNTRSDDGGTIQHYTLSSFAGMEITHTDINAALSWPAAHPFTLWMMIFFFVGAAVTAAGILLLIPLAITALLILLSIYLIQPALATYSTAARLILHATTLPVTAVVLLTFLPAPQLTLGIFLALAIFFAILNLHRVLRLQRHEADMSAEK